ncbi:hypothetical protein LOAG_02207 [Loa loa]|uniref:Secreted protein n=1 Tax=Loa loa TaxID=7209 RepID=A0A1I7VMP5_LOALO|nr:hypothetical protein LOAG_02207 [Loa loa]EFO26287.2 hypothetical protein LOAG_02207 [Loa loa]
MGWAAWRSLFHCYYCRCCAAICRAEQYNDGRWEGTKSKDAILRGSGICLSPKVGFLGGTCPPRSSIELWSS